MGLECWGGKQNEPVGGKKLVHRMVFIYENPIERGERDVTNEIRREDVL